MFHRPGETVDADSVFGLRVFGVHLDAELFIEQHHEGDGPRLRLHVEQARVLHHQPAAHTQIQIYNDIHFTILYFKCCTQAEQS